MHVFTVGLFIICVLFFLESERFDHLHVCVYVFNKLPPSRCMKVPVTVIDTVIKKYFMPSQS